MKKLILLIFSLFLLVLIGCGQVNESDQDQTFSDTEKSNQAVEEDVNLDVNSTSETVKEPEASFGAKVKEVVKETAQGTVERVGEVVADVKNDDLVEGLPETFDRPMDFARQAPYREWEVNFYQNGCEEASLVMAQKFFAGKSLDESIMKVELDKVAPWELERFGENLSVNTDKVKIMAEEYFDLKAEISKEVTIEKIKKELVAGSLIILPLTGKDLNNSNYTDEGPLYHMLVVKGYDRDQFITNDPGTRKGKDYKYKYDVLINAIHDWKDGDIYNGERMMLIVSPK